MARETALLALLCACAAAPTAASLGVTAAAWNDSFAFANTSLWTQSTDIEHCSDGACFQARVDHLSYGASGLLVCELRE